MRIDNFMLKNISLDNKDYVLKQGMVFKGKIIEMLNNLITIDIKGKGVIQASLESNINLKLGDELSFLVKDISENQVNIKVINQDENLVADKNILGKENLFLGKLLKDMGIKETKLSTTVIENLIKSNVQITEPKVTEIIKVLEKIIQLSNISDDEEIVMLKSNYVNSIVEPKIEDMDNEESNFNKVVDSKLDNLLSDDSSVNLETKEKIIEKKLFDNIFIEKEVANEDIKKLIVVKKDENIDLKDLKEIVSKFLSGEKNLDENSNYFKIINFLSKNKMNTSLNNIKNLEEFSKEPVVFVNNLESMLKDLNINNQELNIDENRYDIDNNIFDNIDEKIDKLNKMLIKSLETKDFKDIEDIKDSINKLEFLKDLNKDMTFMYFPINKGDSPIDGMLTLLKENKKRKNPNEPINVYMSLNTKNLGNIKISCQLLSDVLNVKINLNEEDLDLFKNYEKLLIEKINALGYSLNKIDFIVNDSINILDSNFINDGSNYILDLKV